MKNRNEFFEYVRENIKDYLPPSFEGVQISVKEKVKENDRKLHDLTIPLSEDEATLNICLEGFYQCYQGGKNLDVCVGDIADVYIAYCGLENLKDMANVWDYKEIKERLMIKLCDPELNQKYLADKVYTMHGDFAATYLVVTYEGKEGYTSVPVTEMLMKAWGISLDQLHKDAILANKSNPFILSNLDDLISFEFLGGRKPDNFLTEGTKYHPGKTPLLYLSNGKNKYGASLILHGDIMKRVGEILGSDFYVLPSSIHETLLMPSMGGQDVSELSLMVKEINETKVEPNEKLSDKVQYYDRKTAVLENAEARVRRISSLNKGSE